MSYYCINLLLVVCTLLVAWGAAQERACGRNVTIKVKKSGIFDGFNITITRDGKNFRLTRKIRKGSVDMQIEGEGGRPFLFTSVCFKTKFIKNWGEFQTGAVLVCPPPIVCIPSSTQQQTIILEDDQRDFTDFCAFENSGPLSVAKLFFIPNDNRAGRVKNFEITGCIYEDP